MSTDLAALTCPGWCGRPAGHPFGEDIVGARFHTRTVARGQRYTVGLLQIEPADERYLADDRAPHVTVTTKGLGAGQARALAQALLDAAGVLDGARA